MRRTAEAIISFQPFRKQVREEGKKHVAISSKFWHEYILDTYAIVTASSK